MTLTSQKLINRKVAGHGALKHLAQVDTQLKFMRAHINTTNGLASGKATLDRMERLAKSLRRNVSEELKRVDARLRKIDTERDAALAQTEDAIRRELDISETD